MNFIFLNGGIYSYQFWLGLQYCAYICTLSPYGISVLFYRFVCKESLEETSRMHDFVPKVRFPHALGFRVGKYSGVGDTC
jgi:hypothetical protein